MYCPVQPQLDWLATVLTPALVINSELHATLWFGSYIFAPRTYTMSNSHFAIVKFSKLSLESFHQTECTPKNDQTHGDDNQQTSECLLNQQH